MKKRFLSTMLASTFVLGLTGYGSSAVFADEENTTLRIMVYDRGNTTETYGSATDNYWTRWLQKDFGDPNNITLEYVAVPRSEDDKKIKESEANVLSQNLTGFASCFPDWDLHPPVA